MAASLAAVTKLQAEKLRWDKYSSLYRKRLCEGGEVLASFLHQNGVGWERIQKGKARMVDDLLEAFVREMHDQQKPHCLRVTKHAVLLVQVLRPRLRHSLPATWSAIKSWEEQKPANFRPPVPIALLAVMTCKARILSETCESA